MTNVLLIYSEMNATFIETKQILNELKCRGYFEMRIVKTKDINKMLLKWCDILFGIRSTESLDNHLFKYARNKGVYIIELLDDDFLSLGSDYGSEGQGFWWGRKKTIIKIMRNIDCLLSLNKHIIEKYGKIGNVKDTYVFNIPMNTEGFIKPSMHIGKIKIVYYVNDGTTDMFNKYIRPALPFIVQELKDKVSFYFLALHPDMSEFDGRLEYHYIPHMSFDKFLQYLKDEKFDIGLAPLDDSGFSKFKYINKFVEYTRAGVAGIYSDCELYRTVIKNGNNGILCSEVGESWEKAVKSLVENPQIRLNIANNAQQYAKDHFAKDKVLEGILKGIPALTHYKAPKRNISNLYLTSIKLYYSLIFRPCGWMYTLYCCIKNKKTGVIIHRFRRKILKQTV